MQCSKDRFAASNESIRVARTGVSALQRLVLHDIARSRARALRSISFSLTALFSSVCGSACTENPTPVGKLVPFSSLAL
jgi:hypothetical protein